VSVQPTVQHDCCCALTRTHGSFESDLFNESNAFTKAKLFALRFFFYYYFFDNLMSNTSFKNALLLLNLFQFKRFFSSHFYKINLCLFRGSCLTN